MTGTLTVTREGFGIELRRGTFDILVDGGNVGSVQAHGMTEAPIEAGSHTVQMRAGRYSSRPHSFEVADSEVVRFRCHGANLWPLYVASILKPDLAISLKAE